MDTSSLHRRLLQPILRMSHTRQWPCSPRSIRSHRCIKTSSNTLSSPYTITFGTETDQLLAEQPDKTKTPGSTTRTKTSKARIAGAKTKGNTLKHNHEAPPGGVGNDLMVKQSGPVDEDTDLEPVTIEVPEVSVVASEELSVPEKAKRTPQKEQNLELSNHGLDKKKTRTNAENLRPSRRLNKMEAWQIQKQALQNKYGETGWTPRKRLSPDAIEGLRQLHAEDPDRYSTPVLADRFKVSPEAIRRILKGNWRPTAEQMEDRRERWARRHDRIWDTKAALGQRPARKKEKKPDGPEVFEEELRAKQMLGQI